MTPEIFGKKMILEQGFSKAETLSVQAFTRGTFFVTFVSFQACRRYWDMVKASGPESPFRKFAANCPITRDEKWVTVAMRNPHTSGKDIATYLQRFCTVVKDPVRILDANGFWIGKWSVLCKFRKDPSGDILHLQPCFSLGNSAGILFYPGIPFTCNRCSNTGHMGKDCKEPACRFCRVAGHETKDCPRSKACNLCGAAEHVFKHCPQRSRSYAGALIQGKPSSSTRKKPPEREKEPQKTTGKHTPTPTPVQAPARTPAPTSSTPPPATPVLEDTLPTLPPPTPDLGLSGSRKRKPSSPTAEEPASSTKRPTGDRRESEGPEPIVEDLESAGEEDEDVEGEEEVMATPEPDLPSDIHVPITQKMMDAVLQELGLSENTGQAEEAAEDPPPGR
ncbi:uncharacterized protein LOC143986747 [Lithobates pipiens]